ncbi:MAG: hypothetical protein Q9191_008188 [Dirinaria sp. TL-2023a]
MSRLINSSALRALRSSQTPAIQVRQSRYYQVPHETTFDQTKKGNDPKAEEDKSAKPQSSDKPESHPMKQPDPQKPPSSSTGIETEGPGGSKAGKGKGGS